MSSQSEYPVPPQHLDRALGLPYEPGNLEEDQAAGDDPS
jgi:hypothetical protein